MDTELQKQLVRQLKTLNRWFKLFASIILILILVLAYLIFRVITFVHDTDQKLENLQHLTSQKLDIKQRACEGDGNVSGIIRDKTRACD